MYDVGEDPDYRFSFANERTFLAWIRSALALFAAGVALDAVQLSISETAQRGLAAVLVAMGAATSLTAWLRWMRAERALRLDGPLPGMRVGAVLVTGLVIIGVVVLVLLI